MNQPLINRRRRTPFLRPIIILFSCIGHQFEACISCIRDKFQAGSILGSIFTLMMVSLGSGLLSLPYAFAQSGILWTIIQLAVCAFFSYFSLTIIVKCARLRVVSSYQELAEISSGKHLRHFVNVIFFFGGAGSALVYFQVVSLFLALYIAFAFGWAPDDMNTKLILILLVTFIVVPLCLPKKFQRLRYLWFVGSALILFIVAVIISNKFTYTDPTPDLHPQPINWTEMAGLTGFSNTFSIAVFAFMCHFNILGVYGELRNSTEDRMQKVIIKNTIAVFFVYITAGIFGYLTFVDSVGSKLSDSRPILLKYNLNDTDGPQEYPDLIVTCLLIMSVILIVKSPTYIKPAKDGLKDFWYPMISDDFGEPIDTNESFKVHCVLVLVTVYSGVLVAMLGNDMTMVMNVVGSTFYVLTCYVFPAMFYLKLEERDQTRYYKVFSWIMLVSMAIFGVWSTTNSIVNIILSIES